MVITEHGHAWEQFSEQTKTTLDATATGIALEARDHDVISDALIPIDLDEDDVDENEDKQPLPRAQTSRLRRPRPILISLVGNKKY